ncbi:MAG TPA: acyltransferase, partial [Noviherbaspirillum sp.]
MRHASRHENPSFSQASAGRQIEGADEQSNDRFRSSLGTGKAICADGPVRQIAAGAANMKIRSNSISPASGSNGKIIFADQLRAVAALCVLIVHLLGMYWLGRDVVAAHIFAPALQGPSAKSLAAISFTYFNFGPFGVALFFLVSGFVIPFSVTKATRLRFLAARALRIYPTYAACAALGLLAVWLSSRFWHLPFDWSAKQVLQNVLLVHNLAGTDSIDMVNWSLAIEIKFYLIACLLAAPIARGRILPLLGASLAVALAIAGIAYGVPGGSVSL